MYLPEPRGDDFELPSPGTHLAVCYRVIDLGTQRSTFQSEVKFTRKLLLGWELCGPASASGHPLTVAKRYTLSASRRATLRRDLEAWRGRPFSDAELGRGGTFKLESLLGRGCFVSIQHAEREGQTYANVVSLVALPAGTGVPPTHNARAFLSLEREEFDPVVYDSLSAGLRETIASSPEYARLSAPTPGVPATPPASQPAAANTLPDDDIPL